MGFVPDAQQATVQSQGRFVPDDPAKPGMIDMRSENIGQRMKDVGNFIADPAGSISKAITGKTISENIAGDQSPVPANAPFTDVLAKNARVGLGEVAENAANLGIYAGVGKAIEGVSNLGKATEEGLNNLINSHADAYRKILNPSKGILNSTNVDVDNASKTLADHGVIIKTDVNNKIDNSAGIQQLQDANKPLFDQAQKIIQSNPNQKFDLDQIAVDAKANASKYIKNAEERINAKDQIDNLIHAEIQENGGSSLVDASKLYTIKQGMYERAYKPLEPTSNDGARSIGSTIKTNIEKAFPDSPVKDINSKIGDNLEAQTLLEKTNGNVVQGGKLGQGLGRVIGGGVGALSGAHTGLPVAPEIGAVVGQEVGARAVNFMNDPEKLTSAMSKRLNDIRANLQASNSQNFSEESQPSYSESYNPRMAFAGKVSNGASKAEMDAADTTNSLKGSVMGNMAGNVDMAAAGKPFAEPTVTVKPNEVNPTFSSEAKNMESEGGKPIGPNLSNNKGIVSIGDDLNGKSKEELQQSLDYYKNLRSRASGQVDKSNFRDANVMVNKITNAIGDVGKSPLGVTAAAGVGAGLSIGAGNAQAKKNVDMNKIYKIESSNNPGAFNRATGAVGLGQITPIALKEWNNFHPNEKYQPIQLRQGEINKKVSSWLMNERIPQMLKHFKIADNVDNRLIAYNAGIQKLVRKLPLKQETIDYLKKYKNGG